jgi:hypothetical protein
MIMETEGPAERTRPQICREAALRRGGWLEKDPRGPCWSLLMHVGRMVHAIRCRSMRLSIMTLPNQMCAATRRNTE